MTSNQYEESCLRVGEESYTSNKADFDVEPADKPEMSITGTKDNYRRATNENLALSTSAKATWRLLPKESLLDLITLEPWYELFSSALPTISSSRMDIE